MALNNTAIYEETILLYNDYKESAWFQFKRKRKIKEKIYALQIPIIRKQIKSVENVEEKLIEKEYSRIYVSTVSFLLNKKYNSKKFHSTVNPKSKKNAAGRNTLSSLLAIIMDDTATYLQIEKALKHVSFEDRKYFEKITKTNLDIFYSLMN